MKLFKLFRRKKWSCLRCGDFYGDMKVVRDVDSPANYAIDDYKDVVYQILKCSGCGKYTVVGPYPPSCCGRDHKGVLITSNGEYYTYCEHCLHLATDDILRNDQKGCYIEHYRYDALGQLRSIGSARVKVLPTFQANELIWK